MPSLMDKAIEFLDEQSASDPPRPFFLYLPLTAPHTPVVPTEAFIGSSQAGPYGDYTGIRNFDADPRFAADPDTKDAGFGEPPIVDMGACVADLDGNVGASNLLALFANWGLCP